METSMSPPPAPGVDFSQRLFQAGNLNLTEWESAKTAGGRRHFHGSFFTFCDRSFFKTLP